MQTESKISYWVSSEDGGSDDQILTVSTAAIPVVGEIMHIDTQMSKHWYDMHFPELKKAGDKFYQKGVKGDFEVIRIKRWYSVYDIKDTEFNMPSQRCVENFEVFVKLVEDEK